MKARIPLFDSVRGFALALMFVFHFCFDLKFVGLWPVDLQGSFWVAFRVLIVTLFTGLVGVGFRLGANSYRAPRFWIREGKILGGALFLSLATYLLFPGAWVYFGVLHFILVASLLGPVFARVPWLCAPLGLGLVLLPLAAKSARFNGTFLGLSGLGLVDPGALDFVPLLPWLGVTMLGCSVGNFLTERNFHFLRREIPFLSLLGRHSLLLYLTHQMAFLPLVWSWAFLQRIS